ncbi:MAG: ABC transporter ATP-binding protein [Myxococcales bacterium]|nr:ABC transporter ATP-binding protein [Myxococcales bacterium]
MSIDAVEVRGLGKRYGLHRALHDVDLDLHAGGVCALLGPNGAGKSTLLGILSSIVKPNAGVVRYLRAGEALAADASLRREIGVVAHESFLYTGLTALENLDFWGQLYQVEGLEQRSRDLLREVGLDEKAWERTAGTYSRGMLQRLSVARTMLHEPSVLLLDEPFTGLDRGGSQALAEALSGAVKRGAVVLVITHDLESIAGITTHVAVLRRGKLAFEERRASGYSFEELKDTYHSHSE